MARRHDYSEITVTFFEKMAVLSKSQLCNQMDKKEIELIAPYFNTYKIDSGATIYCEGDEEAFLFLIVSGSVNINKGNKHISTLGAGETIGEMTLIDELPRSADAVAATEVVLYAITRGRINELHGKCISTWSKLFMNIAICLSNRLRLTNELLSQYMR